MIRMLIGMVVGYAVFRLGLKVVDENRSGAKKVLPSPPNEVRGSPHRTAARSPSRKHADKSKGTRPARR